MKKITLLLLMFLAFTFSNAQQTISFEIGQALNVVYFKSTQEHMS